jgi:hypothetical protein
VLVLCAVIVSAAVTVTTTAAPVAAGVPRAKGLLPPRRGAALGAAAAATRAPLRHGAARERRVWCAAAGCPLPGLSLFSPAPCSKGRNLPALGRMGEGPSASSVAPWSAAMLQSRRRVAAGASTSRIAADCLGHFERESVGITDFAASHAQGAANASRASRSKHASGSASRPAFSWWPKVCTNSVLRLHSGSKPRLFGILLRPQPPPIPRASQPRLRTVGSAAQLIHHFQAARAQVTT